MENSFIPDYPGEEPEDKTSEEEISEKEAEENILNSLDKSEDYSEIINKINKIPDEKIRKVFLEFAEYSYFVGGNNLKISQKVSDLEKMLRGSHLDDSQVKKALTSIKTTIEQSDIRNTLNDIFDILLAKRDEIAEYISSPDGKERLEKLKKTSSGKKIIKSVLSPFKKLRISSWVGAGIIAIAIGSPLAIFGLWKYYQSSSGKLDTRTTQLENSYELQQKEINNFFRILAEGPKNEEEEKLLNYFNSKFLKTSQLENTLKDYSTTEDTKNAVETAKSEAIESSRNYADEKYSFLNSEISSYTTRLTSLETRANSLETDLQSKLNSEDFEKFKTEEIENYQKQLNLYDTQLNEYKILAANLEKELTKAKISREQYEALKKDLEKTNNRYEELNKKYDTLKKALDKKQDKPKKFLGIIPRK